MIETLSSTSNPPNYSFDYLYSTNGTVMATSSYPQQPTAVHWLNFPVYDASGRQLAIFGAGTIHYDHLDWLHMLRLQTDASGATFQTFTNYPFGDNMITGNPKNTFTGKEFHFTGKERDTESGLDYFGARYYTSSMGRFMSADWSPNIQPVPYANLGDPQSLNLYIYAGNNPLSRFDLDGHKGGDPKGPTVPLDGAYHQMITNEFRNQVPYGNGPVNPQQMQNVMDSVYDKYPLPPGSN